MCIAIIGLHLLPVGLRLHALGSSFGSANWIIVPIIGQWMYIRLFFADDPQAEPEHGTFPRSTEQSRADRRGSQTSGSFPQSTEQSSDPLKRERAVQKSIARHIAKNARKSRSRARPHSRAKSPERPWAIEWTKAADSQVDNDNI